MKIGTKLVAFIFALQLIAFVAIGVIVSDASSNSLFTSYQSSMTTSAVQYATILDDKINAYQADLGARAQNIADKMLAGTAAKSVLQDNLDQERYANLTYVSLKGEETSVTDVVVPYGELDVYKAAQQGTAGLSAPIAINDDPEQLYFLGAAPVLQNGQVQGVLLAAIPYAGLYQYIADIDLGQTGYAFVNDNTGATIIHPVTEKVVTHENANDQVAANPALQPLVDVLKKQSKGETGFDQYVYNGTAKFMSYAPSPALVGQSRFPCRRMSCSNPSIN